MQPSRLAKRLWFLIFLAVIAFYFYGLGHIPLVGPDEPRYAQVAREMFLRGDLITPTLGGHTWFEKPPLLYWMMIGAFSLFGISEWAARLAPAVSGLLTVAAVLWIARRVCRTTAKEQGTQLGVWSAFIAASTLGIIVFSRGAGFDGILTMTITWALGFFLIAETTGSDRKQLLWAGFYIFIGLSLLAKGLVGLVVPFGVVGAYYLIRRELPTRAFLLSLIWGLPLALAVAAVWYVPVIKRHGWVFIDEFFLQHHFARYLSNKYHHPQPFFFYFLIIIPLTLPWTAFLVEGLAKARYWRWLGQDAIDKMRVFAVAWLLFPLLFFSFSGSKLPGYILPVLPAVALIAGERLASFASHCAAGIWTIRITGALCGVFAVAGIVSVSKFGNIPLSGALMTAIPVMVAAIICLFWTRFRTASGLSIGLATFTAIVIALNCGAATIASRESTQDLIQLAAARGYGSSPIYALHQIDRSAEFYAAGRVVYGSDGDPVRFESALDVMEAMRKTNSPILVYVPDEYLYQLTNLKGVRVDLIGSNGVLALVGISHP